LFDIVPKHCTIEIMISDFLHSDLSTHCRLRRLLLPRITLCRTPSGLEIDPSQITLLENIRHSKETDIHSPVGIRTCNPKKRAAADPRLRPHGHRDRWSVMYEHKFIPVRYMQTRTTKFGSSWRDWVWRMVVTFYQIHRWVIKENYHLWWDWKLKVSNDTVLWQCLSPVSILRD